jgi:hypothetical protein
MAQAGNDMELETSLDAAAAAAPALQKGYLYTKYFDPTNKKLGDMKKAYEEAQLQADAALDVRFDVAEAVRGEQLIPEVELSDDSKDELRARIKPLREKEGGSTAIEELLIKKFDANQALEAQYRQNKDDSSIATAVATAREEYRFLKEYVAETAAQQSGPKTE